MVKTAQTKEEPPKKFQKLSSRVGQDPTLMTCVGVEPKQESTTAPNQNQNNLLVQAEDQQSSYSELLSTKTGPKRSKSPEKIRKQVT